MKRTSRLNWSRIAVIGGLLSAAAAYGQTKITAEIPFSFRTAAGVQPAGQYAVIPANLDDDVLAIQSIETGRSTLLGMGARDSANDTRPRLVFHCGSEGGCALTGVWMSDGRRWAFKTPKIKPSEQEHVAVVYFNNKQSE